MNKPCKECPFNRHVQPGLLGGARPEVYVGQITLPFWLPCHMDRNYRGRETNVNDVCQCAGAAIMRANIGCDVRPPLLRLPPGSESFTTLAEFYAHHTGWSIERSAEYLTPSKVIECAMVELNDPRVKTQLKRT